MKWRNEEFEKIDLGDERLNKRAVKILGAAINGSERSIPEICNI